MAPDYSLQTELFLDSMYTNAPGLAGSCDALSGLLIKIDLDLDLEIDLDGQVQMCG